MTIEHILEWNVVIINMDPTTAKKEPFKKYNIFANYNFKEDLKILCSKYGQIDSFREELHQLIKNSFTGRPQFVFPIYDELSNEKRGEFTVADQIMFNFESFLNYILDNIDILLNNNN